MNILPIVLLAISRIINHTFMLSIDSFILLKPFNIETALHLVRILQERFATYPD